MQPIDELDRKTANDMRLRHYSGEITSVDSSTTLAHGLRPRASLPCYVRRSLSAKASHNVLVVDATATVSCVFTLPFLVTVPRPPCKDHIRIYVDAN